MKELVKKGYHKCEPINIGGTGVIFMIYSKEKGTNILKIDCKDQACMENEIKMHDRLNSIFFSRMEKEIEKKLDVSSSYIHREFPQSCSVYRSLL